MGREHDTYYFSRSGQDSHQQNAESVVEVHSVEHDGYGGATYTASVIDLAGAKEMLPLLRGIRPSKERSAIQDAISKAERSH